MTDTSDVHDHDDTESGSGSYSIRGYEYQIDVSIWMALDIVLSKQYSDHLVLEPASEEDIEAEVVDQDVGTITSTTSMEGYRLIVQSKRRSGDAWRVNDIKRLLKHGVRRESASERLRKPNARYLLVTNAGANGGMRSLKMNELILWPTDKMPVSLVSALPADCTGRVAVFANMDEERLDRRIRDLLTGVGKVPTKHLDRCLAVLREEARSRVMGAGEGRWTREQLIEVVKQHDGYVASSHDIALYVRPSNWDDILDKMEVKSAALLIGQSGTGKTMTTKALFEELRAQHAGLNRVAIDSPKDINRDTTPSPVLFDIEDPWGKFDFDPQRRDWNQEITKVFSEATPQRMVIATTRRDVAHSAHVLKAIEPWAVALEAESYQPEQRSRLYQSRIQGLPRNLHILASDAESHVLSNLNTPLEIQKFFDALSHEPDNEESKLSRVQGAISKAHEESIERTVREQIGQRKDLPAATVLWALFKASDKVSFRLITELQDELSDRSNEDGPDLIRFVQFFVAARNLRQVDSSVSYYHPRVEAGVQRLLQENRLEVRRVLARLVDVLTSLTRDVDDKGVAMAALVLKAERSELEFDTAVSQTAMEKIDSWLNAQLTKGGRELEKRLALAAVVGSGSNNQAEVARFLQHRPDQTFPGFSNWHLPDHDEAWYSRMKADPAVRRLVELFVEEVLWETRDSFNETLVDTLERFAPGLATSYRTAALRIVSYGVHDNIDVIAKGSLLDLAGYEAVVDAAVDELRKIYAPSPQRDEEHMNLVNEVYSEDYVEWTSDNDEGYTATEFLKLYVERVREIGMWPSLATHRHRSDLLEHWTWAIWRESAVDVRELRAAFEQAGGGEAERTLWSSVTFEHYSDFRALLMSRLLDEGAAPGVWRSALKAMVGIKPEDLVDVVTRLNSGRLSSRSTEIALELGRLRANPRRDEYPSLHIGLEGAFYGLSSALQGVAVASFSAESKDTPILCPEAASWLGGVDSPSEEVRVFRLMMATQVPLDLQDDIRWVLSQSDDADNCALAMEVAVQNAMADEVEAGLSHRFAKVVAISLREAAKACGVPLPAHLLELVHSKPSPIRRTLAVVLSEKHHEDHLATLLVLAHDGWSQGSRGHGEEADHPIARLAVKGLMNQPHVDVATAHELLGIAQKTHDSDLRFDIFDLLVQRAGNGFQRRLIRGTLTAGRRSATSCARALLGNYGSVDKDAIEAVSVEALATAHEPVAVMLLALVGLRATPQFVLSTARALAGDVNKKVLLLPLLWAQSEVKGEALSGIVSLLPPGHEAVAIVTSGDTSRLDSKSLEDIGDARNVSAVVSLLNP